jgi:hypothetical protein
VAMAACTTSRGRARRGRRPRAGGAGRRSRRDPPTRSSTAAAAPADLLVARPRARPAHGPRRRPGRPRPRRHRHRGRRARRPAPRRRGGRRRGRHLFPAFVDRTCTCGTPGQEAQGGTRHGTRAARAGGLLRRRRDAEHRPGRRLRPILRALATRRRARPASPSASCRRSPAACGRGAHRMAELRARAPWLHRRRRPSSPAGILRKALQYQRLRRRCSRCTRRTRRSGGAARCTRDGLRAARRHGDPVVSESTMAPATRAAGYEGAGAHAAPPPRVGQRSPPRGPAACA